MDHTIVSNTPVTVAYPGRRINGKRFTIRGRREIMRPEVPVEPRKTRINEQLVEVLEKLVKLMRKKRDFIRQTAYRRALETVNAISYDIADPDELANKKYIGPTIIAKFKEYLDTGTLRVLEREAGEPGLNALYDQFTQIYGVGPKKAQELIDAGITSMDELQRRQDELLTGPQKAGLRHYDDLLERIPRDEIDDYARAIRAVIDKLPTAKCEVVGSYRRGAANSGDIDVIITSADPRTFKTFVDVMKAENIILETLSCGPSKCLVIARLANYPKARRVDFLYAPAHEYPFAILYFTGSKAFNTVMRSHALRWGLSMNEHGLYRKEPGQKKEERVGHVFETERDIFDYLKLEYREPRERGSGEAVILTAPIPEYRKPRTMKVREPGATPAPTRSYKKREPETKVKTPVQEDDKPVVLTLPNPKRTYKKREPKQEGDTKPKQEGDTKPKQEGDAKPKRTYKKREPKQEGDTKPKRTYKKREPNQEGDVKPKRTYKKREPKINVLETLVPIVTQSTVNYENAIPVEKPLPAQVKTDINAIRVKYPQPEMEQVDANRRPLDIARQYKTGGISVLETLPEDEIAKVLEYANNVYYNGNTPVFTDNEYDIIKEYMERKYPANPILNQIGAPITKNKATLPYNMPSMDKIKPDTNALDTWTKKYTGPYVVSCKLDGVSGLYVWNGTDSTAKLYTRGDGLVGQDITHLLKALKLPRPPSTKIAVRGEFILPKTVFESKYSGKFANPRNLVSGIINSKTVDEKAVDLHFVAYEVIDPPTIPSVQMATLATLGFEVVQYTSEAAITNESLSSTLVDWRTHYMYEIDGIIVADDHIHMRKQGNPDHAFAFKMVMGDQLAEAKVVDVLWEASKSGYLKPRVRIEPIRLSGVTIEYATGFNGAFIESNKIGIGAVIQIVRSGDVIPHIKSVTTPAEHAKMPSVPYHWTDTRVDIVLDNMVDDNTVREKNITAFFTTLGVDGLSSGNVKRIMNAGYDSVAKILKMEKTDFERVEGFKEKMVDKIYGGIRDKVANASLLTIMVASNVLGRGLGERKIKPILEMYPDILTSSHSDEQKMADLRKVPGIGNENAKMFVSNIPAFLAFLKECGLQQKLSVVAKPTEEASVKTNTMNTAHVLSGKHMVMTKVRDSTVIDKIARAGGFLDDNIGKNTFALIVKTKGDVSNKTKYASEHGIPIMTVDEFASKYLP